MTDRPKRHNVALPDGKAVSPPNYHWGGYDEGPLEIRSGHVTGDGYGPYVSEDAAGPGARTQAARPGERSDARIAADVIAVLAGDARLAACDIVCEVKDGVVYLFGAVPTLFLRELAGKCIADILGVHAIANRLKLGDAESGPARS